MQLRPYQLQKIAAPSRIALRDNQGVVPVAATGAGKTQCAGYMTKGADDNGLRTLIINHRPEIHGQFMRSLNAWGVRAGQIVSGRTMTNERTQVGMIQTLINRLDDFAYDFDLVIVDEGHHCAESNSWGRALNHPRLKNAKRILFTATPQGLTSGRGLHPFATKIIQGVSTIDLINDGWLVYPQLKRPPKEITDKFKITRGEYDKTQQEEIFSRKVVIGDAFDHYRQFVPGFPQITACSSLKHAHNVTEYYNKEARNIGASWRTVMVQGGQKYRKQREDAIKGLATGSVQNICFVDVFGEGIDVPVCMSIQWLRKTMSLVNWLQFNGRVFRPLWPDGFDQYASTRETRLAAIASSIKPQAMIFDHAGNYYIHKHPIIRRDWSLDDTRSGADVTCTAPVITTCPACNSVWPGRPRICPSCGADIKEERPSGRKDPKTIEAMLIDAGAPEEDIAYLVRKTMEIDKLSPKERQARMLGALRFIEPQKVAAMADVIGYKKNWTRHMCRKLGIKYGNTRNA